VSTPPVSRRGFLRLSAMAAGAAGMPSAVFGAGAAPESVAIIVAPDDRVAASAPVGRAVAVLQTALAARGIAAARVDAAAHAPASALRLSVAGRDTPHAGRLLQAAGVTAPAEPEGVALVTGTDRGAPAVAVCSAGARGLMYGVFELADRVEHAADPLATLRSTAHESERPFTRVRAIGRPFVSDVEDKPWFHDRAFWPSYFAMLARHRFNRFHFCLGLGYDTLREVRDSYLLFAYPFLLGVPGYQVRATNLPDAERDRNLEMLRAISAEAAAHGIDFQLGLWTHWHAFADSPDCNYPIEGLTSERLAPYCRDALTEVLRACPSITGVTLRTHYESGVREGSYTFWKTVFEAMPKAGRTLELELHGKGLDQTMIANALATGMPVRVSPKYWAEHTGLPYHQTAIRDLELPHVDTSGDGFSALSTGVRNHTRYGYADFMQETRPYGVMFRVFPGSHKFLLWGDPLTAAAHARAFGFCGSDGAELFEPLSFKGRRGSGRTDGRCAYRDAALAPRRDWEKFAYTYRVWGRLLYNPDAQPDVWRRALRQDYGAAAAGVESALGPATRIFPLVVTAHLPSAAHDTYTPECYSNQSMVDPAASPRYSDTPEPRVFGRVSPLDPEIFSTIDEHARDSLAGRRGGKYSPIEVAQWIDDLAASAERGLRLVRDSAGRAPATAVRVALVDIGIQVGIGRFFAEKLRAGVLLAIHEHTGDREALVQALARYRSARDAWSRMTADASAVYVPDITFGPLPDQRGHWADRLPAMDADIAALDRRLATLAPKADRSAAAAAAVAAAVARQSRDAVAFRHTAPAGFTRGRAIEIALDGPPSGVSSVTLHYRRVTQAERYVAVEMTRRGPGFAASIPATYTDSPFPVQYYFVWRTGPASAGLYPGLPADLAGQPYFVLRQHPHA
jgi:hypothetical protein